MTTALDWQGRVGQAWAESYAQTDRSLAGLTAALLERIRVLPGEAVLDIGCGAGELSLAVARTRPRARVIGVDIAHSLVAAAGTRGGQHGNAQFLVGDAAHWSLPGFDPDLLISRHGVMFFDDPVGAFTHLATIAAPGAHLVFSCFRSPRDNRWATDLADLFGLEHPDTGRPGPFAFSEPQKVEALLTAAGWGQVDIAPADFAYVAGVGSHAADEALAFFGQIGPAASALAALPLLERRAGEERLRSWIEAHRRGEIVAFGAGAWIVTARK